MITPSVTSSKQGGFINGTVSVAANGVAVGAPAVQLDSPSAGEGACAVDCGGAALPSTSAFACTYVCSVTDLARSPRIVSATVSYAPSVGGPNQDISGGGNVTVPGIKIADVDTTALLTGVRLRPQARHTRTARRPPCAAHCARSEATINTDVCARASQTRT